MASILSTLLLTLHVFRIRSLNMCQCAACAGTRWLCIIYFAWAYFCFRYNDHPFLHNVFCYIWGAHLEIRWIVVVVTIQFPRRCPFHICNESMPSSRCCATHPGWTVMRRNRLIEAESSSTVPRALLSDHFTGGRSSRYLSRVNSFSLGQRVSRI